VAGLLGCFGPYRQYANIRKLSKVYLPPLSSYTSEHIEFLEIGELWEQLHKDISQCKWQSDIELISNNGFKLLFWNKQLENIITSTTLQEEELLELLQHVIRSPEDHTLHMTQLKHGPLASRIPKDIMLRLERSSMCYRYIYSSVCKRYGIRGESALIETYNQCHDISIVKGGQRLKKLVELPGESHSIFITGQLDGMQNGVVIEIKHRASKIYNKIPTYELIQLHMYMFLTSTQNCKLIQAIRLPSTFYIEQTTIKFSPTLWMCILQSLAKVVDFLDNLDASEFTLACFNKLPESAKFEMIQKYIPELIVTQEEYQFCVG
jgi:hypothetical protein